MNLVARPESATGVVDAPTVCTTPFAEPQGVPPKIKLTHYRKSPPIDDCRHDVNNYAFSNTLVPTSDMASGCVLW
jgi:hypothetical protein